MDSTRAPRVAIQRRYVAQAMIALDQTPLVAVCDARASKHCTAAQDLESLVRHDFGLCGTSWE